MEGLKPEILQEICVVKMPFGKYKNTILADLPVAYLEWFMRNGGFPRENSACSSPLFTKSSSMD